MEDILYSFFDYQSVEVLALARKNKDEYKFKDSFRLFKVEKNYGINKRSSENNKNYSKKELFSSGL